MHFYAFYVYQFSVEDVLFEVPSTYYEIPAKLFIILSKKRQL